MFQIFKKFKKFLRISKKLLTYNIPIIDEYVAYEPLMIGSACQLKGKCNRPIKIRPIPKPIAFSNLFESFIYIIDIFHQYCYHIYTTPLV